MGGELVYRAGGSYDRPFKALRGVTQGGPLSPRIFNLMVDAIIREWLQQIMSAEVARVGIGEEVRLLLACFYADNGLIASRDPDFLQQAFDILMGLFDRFSLGTNVEKMAIMICQPCRTTGSQLLESHIRWVIG